MLGEAPLPIARRLRDRLSALTGGRASGQQASTLLKTLVVDAAAEVGWRTGVTQPQRRHADQLCVLTFHRVLPAELRERYPYPGLAVTPEQLDFCLAYATERYDVGSLSDQLARFRCGERTDKPLLAVTFDDGQWDNLAYAAPVLARRSVRATFYVPVDAIERAELIWHDRLGYAVLALIADPDGAARVARLCAEHGQPVAQTTPHDVAQAAKALSEAQRSAFVQQLEALGRAQSPDWGRLLTWDEVRTLRAQGHEIGSHSMSHERMTQLEVARVAHEASASKTRIEAALDAQVRSFCYPNGDCDERCWRAVQQAGYDNAVTTRYGTNTRDDNRFELQRCDVDTRKLDDVLGRASRKRFALRLSGLQPGL